MQNPVREKRRIFAESAVLSKNVTVNLEALNPQLLEDPPL